MAENPTAPTRKRLRYSGSLHLWVHPPQRWRIRIPTTDLASLRSLSLVGMGNPTAPTNLGTFSRPLGSFCQNSAKLRLLFHHRPDNIPLAVCRLYRPHWSRPTDGARRIYHREHRDQTRVVCTEVTEEYLSLFSLCSTPQAAFVSSVVL